MLQGLEEKLSENQNIFGCVKVQESMCAWAHTCMHTNTLLRLNYALAEG